MESTDRNPARGELRFGLPFLPGVRGELLLVGFFVLSTLVLTWPIPVTMNQATGLRGDYFNNLWNVWWLRRAIAEGVSPFHTDYLFHPEGLSLLKHTLSPVNALAGVVLSTFLGPHAVFNTVLLLNFGLAAWTFSLFARYLTGSTAASVPAGLLYSFSPFHYYYLCQVNVFSLAWMPLALLWFVRVYREGGRRNTLLAALFTGCIAGSSEYYVLYAVLAVGLMLVLGRLIDPSVRWREGALRLLRAGLLSGVVVALVAAPLLWGTFFPQEPAAGAEIMGVQVKRANDLFGFEWVGGPESLTVSWPTMLGYSTLLLLFLSARRLLVHQRFWLVLGAAFLVLSLGHELHVDRVATGVPLFYGLFELVPGLEMLRKPDRAFLMIQVVAALCLAEAWVGLERRLSGASRRLAWALVVVLPMVELTGVPFHRFDYGTPAYYAALADEEDVESIVDCPPMQMDIQNARYAFWQMTHGKKQPLGYCTILSKGRSQEEHMTGFVNVYYAWINGFEKHSVPEFAKDFPTWVHRVGFDRLVMHKRMPRQRPPVTELNDRTLFQPFFLVRRDLLWMRQAGLFLDQPIDAKAMFELKSLARRDFGNPIHEDDDVVVFAPRRNP